MADDLDFACPVCKKEPSRGIFVGAKIYHDDCLIQELVNKFKDGSYSQGDVEGVLKKVKNSKITKAVEEATYAPPEPEISEEEAAAAFEASMAEAEGVAAEDAAAAEAEDAAAAEAKPDGGLPSGTGGGLPSGTGGGKKPATQGMVAPAMAAPMMAPMMGAPMVGGGGGIPKIKISFEGFRYEVAGTEDFVGEQFTKIEKYIDMLMNHKLGILEPAIQSKNSVNIPESENVVEKEPIIEEKPKKPVKAVAKVKPIASKKKKKK
ncbi:MAG: hypothetical protein GY870_02550 [archaeon]|nr:hypothetical protein [archaeon]